MNLADLFENRSLPLVRDTQARARGSYGAFIITMAPMDFLRLTTTPDMLQAILDRPFPYTADEYREAMGRDTDFGRFSMPFLNVAFPSGQVMGHEGRHRTAMVMRHGGRNIPVLIYPRSDAAIFANVSWFDADDEKMEHRLGPFLDFDAAKKAVGDFTETLDPDAYWPKTKFENRGGGVLKGAPARTTGPWEQAAWRVEDFPTRLIGQFDQSTAVSRYRVGLVKGYHHFKH